MTEVFLPEILPQPIHPWRQHNRSTVKVFGAVPQSTGVPTIARSPSVVVNAVLLVILLRLPFAVFQIF